MPLPRADEDLLDVGLRVARHAADGRAVDGRIAPAEDGEAFLARRSARRCLRTAGAACGSTGQEHHADAVLAGRRQGEAQRGALAREELVRNLDQDAGAVAGFRIAAAGAAVRQVDQDLYALDDDVVRFLTLDVGDEADAAGIVLMAGIVKTLRGR